jgi:hypothetical protein
MNVDVFVSSDSITSQPAKGLVCALRHRGLSVHHSPPWGKEEGWVERWNPEWDDWYGPNLQHAMAEARMIVLVVSRLWQESTWMLAECEATKEAAQKTYAKVFVWNPEAIPITNPNFKHCIAEELPHSLEEAAERLMAELGRPRHER